MSKKIISVVALLSMLILLFSSCTKQKLPESAATETTTEAQTTEAPVSENALLLYDGESFRYTLVRPEKVSGMVLGAFTKLKNPFPSFSGTCR